MSYYPQQKKKRRWVGPVVVLGTLVILVVAAFFVAEKLARDAAVGIIAKPVRSALGASAPVTVELGPGLFLLQAAGGSLDTVTVSTKGLPVGEGSAALTLVAEGVPLSLDGTAQSVDAQVSLDATAMQSLVPEGSQVAFAATSFSVTSQVDIGGVPTPVVTSLVPTAAEGLISLEVTEVRINDAPVDLEQLRSGAYGPAGAALVAPAPMCVSSYLPASLVLSSAAVQGGHLVLELQGTAVKLSSLSTKGVCPVAGE
jgi:hypothetical protein